MLTIVLKDETVKGSKRKYVAMGRGLRGKRREGSKPHSLFSAFQNEENGTKGVKMHAIGKRNNSVFETGWKKANQQGREARAKKEAMNEMPSSLS
ncbi:hypothetical protein V1234_03185 [Serratia marcescens]|uniref:hypothetical protein n=1 Tax=Serratia TaxID=613 RepID=UPI001DDB6F58|nr:hypothetical protein [Serratia marcescens]MBN5185609.1 hypothetical protein [Serratia marcescens]MBN5193409.1 hypothetical protein [Serratia marcescens]WVJ42550.1 hypothetical protein V1234_03185 [Serratia marcescens]BEO26353.1 hypothetical protein SMQC20_49370 [Serratia marcescens]